MRVPRQPSISVIMSIFNQKSFQHLNEAIISVLRQTFTDFEFIIYNDGSEDEVFQQLQRYSEMDERVVLMNNQVNHGLAYSLNACIDVARGKYLARMDGDDICDIHRFRVQYDYLESHPEISFVGCNAALIDDNGIWGHRRMPQEPEKKDFLKYSPYIHPTVMVRRSVLEQGNTYNTSSKTLRCEDYELFMRLKKTGYKGYNIQQELFSYREDRYSYKKRKLKYRIDEMHLRYHNFRELEILSPLGYLYVIRPLLSAITPSNWILAWKRLYHRLEMNYEKRTGEEIITLPENTEKRAKAI